jgi:hypothetical protein
MNFKKLFLGSVFVMSAFGLIACGSDSKSSTEPGPNNPGDPVVVPDRQDANITLSSELVGAGLATNARETGGTMRFKGRFGLDITVDSTNENNDAIALTGIEYTVLDAANNLVGVTVQHNEITFPTQYAIDLGSQTSAGVIINLSDPGFTACGTYNLMVTVKAENGDLKAESTVLIPFTRDPYYCKADEPEPEPEPVKPEVTMSSCDVEMSTNLAPGLNLATCTAGATGDIVFTKAKVDGNAEITATGATVALAPINNGDLPPYEDDYAVDIWPEDMNADRVPAAAYVSDFMFKADGTGSTLTSMIENSTQIYVALAAGYSTDTGVGFYAFAITDYTEGNNGDFSFTVKVYKVP